MNNNADFTWSGQRVVVTGGTGFLGSHLCEALARRKPDALFPIGIREWDLCDANSIRAMLAQMKPTMVIHLAAKVGGIGANREHPAEFFFDNLMMGVQLVHESWKAGVKKMVLLGTVCAYPKFTPVPFKEDDLWNGYPEETNAPYGLAKKMLLVQSQAYRQQYGFNSIFLLPVNLYGPRDHFDPRVSHVIPAIIKKCVDARERKLPFIEAWGDGSPTREFLYAPDAAEGIVRAAERYNQSEPVNLGSAYEISIKDLTETISRLTGFTGEIRWDTTQPNGQPRRKLDTTRAEREFGFKSRTRFEEGLRETIDWYLANRERAG